MKITPQQTAEKKIQLATLKGKGFTQREIAKQLGVSVATIRDWYNSMPLYSYEIIQRQMLDRLKALTQNKETPAMEIYNLTNALASITKTVNQYTKTK